MKAQIKKINICRTLLKNIQKGRHQDLPPGVLRRLKKIEKILKSNSSEFSTGTVLDLIKFLVEILRTLG
jgi:hypothetical protein